MDLDKCHSLAVQLLQELIAIPSLSRDEKKSADRLEEFLKEMGHKPNRRNNNVWVRKEASVETDVSGEKSGVDFPTILLNSHIDTVKPVEGWPRDPFTPKIEEGRLYGLGSNDAGGPMVSLLVTFLHLAEQDNLPYNLVFAATAEEEISGKNGVSSILEELGRIDLGIVGEPTQCKMAVAEKGLMVLDGMAQGKSAHAASGLGTNAIYEAIGDLEWFRTYQFGESSPWLGPVSMQVTQIESGTQHNVVPDACRYVVDVRTNECYDNKTVFKIIRENVSGMVEARSFRLNPSSIDQGHPLVQRGLKLGIEAFGSMTLSDQSLMPFTTIKIGPGDSKRSHTADEFISIDEIREGIKTYIQLLDGLEL